MWNRVRHLDNAARVAGAGAGVAALTLFASVFTVPSGHVGVESLFGDVRSRTYGPGLYFSNPLTIVTLYDTRVQNTPIKCQSVTADGLSITTNLNVRWRFDTHHAAETRRTVSGDVQDTILHPLLIDAVTQSTSRFGTSALFVAKTRTDIGFAVSSKLEEKCESYGIQILDVMVDKLEPPSSVLDAVQKKMSAEQEAERTRYVMEKQRIELAFATEKAQFEADRNMMLARAEADRLKLLAASEAERTLLLAEAESRRRVLEGEGVRAFQHAINSSTSQRVLEWRKIEAAQKLYESGNVKFAFVDPKQPMLLNLEIH